MTKSHSLNIKKHFKKNDPVIYEVIKDLDFNEWLNPRVRKRTKHGYFAALCREIIGQQLSGKVAGTILKRFKELFKSKIVNPKDVLKIKDQKLRDVGMSWAKVSYIKDLALKTVKKELNLKALDKLKDKDVMEALLKVKGIGPWTAEMFLIFTLGREDVFSHGDLGLKKGIEKLYKLKDPSLKQIEKIVKKWSPYKSCGSIALWQSLDS